MTAELLHRFRRVERAALVVGVAGLVAAGVLGWLSPHYVIPAWRLAVFACLQPALGSLIFVLIHRLTGGQWAHGLAPFLLAGARLLPWVWLLALPLLFWPLAGQPATPADARTTQVGTDLSLDRPGTVSLSNPRTALSSGTNARGPAEQAANAGPPGGRPLPQALSSGANARGPAEQAANPGPPGGRPLPRSAAQTVEVDAALEHVFASDGREMGSRLRWYFSRPMLTTRAIVYALVFFLLAFGARPAMRATITMRWFGPLGLLGLVFMLHLLSTDWIVELDPGWFSTGFPLVWMTAQAIAGIALAIAAAVTFGAEPNERGHAGHVRGLDWGNLMLAAIMVWTYVAFVQLLIIWSGNLPSETVWYRHRALGGWRWFSVAVFLIEFGAPFFLLLSRALKRKRRGLALITALLVLGQLGYTTWLIAPAFPQATAHAPWLLLAAVVAALALFVNRYVAGARAAAAQLVLP